jgi:L-methionine (R)-S-oxide reductase
MAVMNPPAAPGLGSGDLLAAIRATLAGAHSLDEKLRRTVGLLSESGEHFTWTGIYLLEGDTLVLHNQVGSPTPHERIPIGRGICGLAAREKQTVVVPDVKRDPRYLACSLSTRSEIVVPIMREAVVLGEIDVDSDRPDAFNDSDRVLLEAVAGLIARIL